MRTHGTPKAFVVISTDLLPLAGQQGSKSLKLNYIELKSWVNEKLLNYYTKLVSIIWNKFAVHEFFHSLTVQNRGMPMQALRPES